MGIDTGAFLIRGARQLLTLHGTPGPRRGPHLKELGIIHDGAVLVRDGIVHQVGTTRRVENLAEARDAVAISAAGRVVMPGLIDGHTHLACPPPGSGDDLEMAARRIRTSSAKWLIARLRTQLEAMVRCGTTTVEMKTCGWLDETVDIKLLRVMAGLRSNPVDIVSSFLFCPPADAAALDACGAETAARGAEQFLLKIAKRRLAAFVCIGLKGGESGRLIAQRLLRAASDAGLAARIDLDADHPADAVALANEYRAISIDHTERVRPENAAILAGFPGIATFLPAGGFYSPEAAGNLRDLADAGAAIALASNFHPRRQPTLNMQTVIALACLQGQLTPEEAISAATVNAAHALGCAERVGSLEVGKTADLLILNAGDYRDACRQIGANLVHLTMKRGAFIYKEGEVARLSADDLLAGREGIRP